MVADGEQGRRGPHLVVCGDDPLAYRLVEELVTRIGDEVTVILPSVERNQGPRIAALPKVRVIEAPELSEGAFRAARVEQASAVALVNQDDVGNIHAALRAQELNSDLRLVIRFFNKSLGHRIQPLFPGCDVLSDADTAAPFFVAGALGSLAPSYVRLPGRTLYVTRRRDVAADRVICTLADTDGPGQPELLPTDQDDADLVLALADGPGVLGGPVAHRRGRNRLRALWWRITGLFNRKLVIATLGLFALLGLGTVLFASRGGFSLGDALYLTLLDAAGAAQPDITLRLVDKITQTMVTVVGISIIPVVTAAVVDAVVGAQLATALGRPRRIAGHVVVVGLGNVGARVLGQLHDLGVPVVCVESDEKARGVSLARRIGVPVVFGDASREDTLRAAHLDTSRALVAVTNNDITNLEAALHGRTMSEELRVVLRLFDSDLAERVQRRFGITISRSVSYLAAPAFAAAMLGRRVLGTIPVGRRVLLITEVLVQAGSHLDGVACHTVNEPRQAQVIAIHRHATTALELPAPPEHLLAGGDRLIVLATRAGLGRILTRSVATSASPS
ncbi:MAG: NAD-binding protein [Pseudonocardiales bacterium]|nr:NAD-binding protein [Pseudonocardiales bacterium]MBV9031136.1 NAD-binding protein [Pseudonocardiales bacterium]MBW0010659.1 NAD-binding protein [Pseudonocardiales bacterium]